MPQLEPGCLACPRGGRLVRRCPSLPAPAACLPCVSRRRHTLEALGRASGVDLCSDRERGVTKSLRQKGSSS
ncbi:hypothetical protein DUNSADRAFT_17580 [Dunaliella salina]|uniref:Encoded protein n=1 Tax=Dunaliella salina TaxID=3046 RepID=A0ABQ7G1K1_DUNSA|nr:hypothetical protein DUNSADRAFT_17580 [Dunaliella salina]|eukprot:KAF5828472.1 hypothetical protein DUNSADRAFT_17580 [Dunaliella salina]